MSALNAPIDVAPAKDVFFLHDGQAFARRAIRYVAMDVRVASHNLTQASPPGSVSAQVLVCCLNRLKATDLPAIRKLSSQFAAPPIILLAAQPRDARKLAKELPDAVFMFEPLNLVTLKTTVRHALDQAVEAAWAKLQPQNREALKASLKSFQSCFAASASGAPLPIDEVYGACRLVKDSFDGGNFGEWLSALQMHHDRTYRHSMMVCGSLTYFCRELGVRSADLEMVSVGGFLHDIGMSRVPQEILDQQCKPGSADVEALRRHPNHSRDILLAETGLDPRILDQAIQHHEFLDGTGFPDGLTGHQISDLVRLTTVVDTYALLTEEKPYELGMTPKKAFDMMVAYRGRLDQALVSRYQELVLDTAEAEAA